VLMLRVAPSFCRTLILMNLFFFFRSCIHNNNNGYS